MSDTKALLASMANKEVGAASAAPASEDKPKQEADTKTRSSDTIILHCPRPNMGAILPNGKRVQFSGYYLFTKSAEVAEELVTNYGRFVKRITQEEYEKRTTLPEDTPQAEE